MILTADLERLHSFYRDLIGGVEVTRIPSEGPTFYLGMQVGDGQLGLVADGGVQAGQPQRFLLSVVVEDVDALLARVEALGV